MYLECEILFSPSCTPSSCSNDCILLAHLLYSEPNGKRRSCVTKSRQGAKLLDGSLVDRMRQASRKYSFAPARPAGLPGPCVLPRISSYAVGRFRLKKKKIRAFETEIHIPHVYLGHPGFTCCTYVCRPSNARPTHPRHASSQLCN